MTPVCGNALPAEPYLESRLIQDYDYLRQRMGVLTGRLGIMIDTSFFRSAKRHQKQTLFRINFHHLA